MNRRTILAVACFVLLTLESFAQDAPAPDTPAPDIQKRAEALLEHARQLSDIRSPNSAAFQLKANFSFTGTDLEPAQGTYTEVWISKSQWRREIAVKDRRRIEVAGPNRIWRIDNTDDFPDTASQLPDLLNMLPSQSLNFVFESVLAHPEINPPLECALTKPDASHRKFAFCFDIKSGVLLERIFPQVRPRNVVEDSCDYGSFHKVGNFWSPREMICFEDRHKKITANIVDLSPAPAAGPAFFDPPPGAIELGDCPVTPVPPLLVSSATQAFLVGAPGSPRRIIDPDRLSWITVWFVVDIKGKPQYARVVRPAPGNKTAEKRILDSVRDWRFKPGTCNGVPMPMPMPLTLQLPN